MEKIYTKKLTLPPDPYSEEGEWCYITEPGLDGLAYYVSLMLGNGSISRNRDGTPLEVPIKTHNIDWNEMTQGLKSNNCSL